MCAVLSVCCIPAIFSETDFCNSLHFPQSDASLGLTLGSFFALVITIVLYQIRHVMTFNDCMGCIPDGFKAMVPAIMILTSYGDLESNDGQSGGRCVCG